MRHAFKLAIVSDLHIGSTVALPAAAEYVLPDGQRLHASPAQMWLLECWHKFWAEFHKIAAKRSAIIVNGEFCEGEHHAAQQISGQAEVMEAMAVELMRKHVGKVDKLFVVRGSGAHSKQQGMADETVARELGAQRNSSGWRSDYRWRIEAGGLVIDAAHHITGGGVPWTAGNNVRRALMTTVLRAVERGERAPDIMLRSHVHQPANYEFGRTRIFVTPSFKLRDEYAHKIGASLAPVGGIIITIDNGVAEVITRTFNPEREKATKL
jgi:hypothetical protein